MDFLIMLLSLFCGVLVLFCCTLLFSLLKSTDRIMETNKQLLIVVAGKDEKPEHALRALVASNKPPQGKLRGIATGEKKDEKKPANVNYEVTIGETHAL